MLDNALERTHARTTRKRLTTMHTLVVKHVRALRMHNTAATRTLEHHTLQRIAQRFAQRFPAPETQRTLHRRARYRRRWRGHMAGPQQIAQPRRTPVLAPPLRTRRRLERITHVRITRPRTQRIHRVGRSEQLPHLGRTRGQHTQRHHTHDRHTHSAPYSI